MAKTYISTTTIVSPTDEISYGYAPCPIPPSFLLPRDESNGPSWAEGIKQSNGDYIYWSEVDIRKSCADGTSITWFKKPTIADSMNIVNGTYYKFNTDGSVEAKYKGYDKTYHWSPEIHGVAEEGELIWTHFNEATQEYEDNKYPVPCKVCGNDCRGSNYEDYPVCSNMCLNINT